MRVFSSIFLILFCSLFLFSLDPQQSINQYILNYWTTNDGLPQNFIRAIAQTPDGYLWFRTQQGLVRFNGLTFKVYDRWNTPELGDITLFNLSVPPKGRFWIGRSGGGRGNLLYYEKDHFQESPLAQTDPNIENITIDNNGNI